MQVFHVDVMCYPEIPGFSDSIAGGFLFEKNGEAVQALLTSAQSTCFSLDKNCCSKTNSLLGLKQKILDKKQH